MAQATRSRRGAGPSPGWSGEQSKLLHLHSTSCNYTPGLATSGSRNRNLRHGANRALTRAHAHSSNASLADDEDDPDMATSTDDVDGELCTLAAQFLV